MNWLKKKLRKFLAIEDEFRGQKLLNAKLLQDHENLEKRIISLAQRVKELEKINNIII